MNDRFAWLDDPADAMSAFRRHLARLETTSKARLERALLNPRDPSSRHGFWGRLTGRVAGAWPPAATRRRIAALEAELASLRGEFATGVDSAFDAMAQGLEGGLEALAASIERLTASANAGLEQVERSRQSLEQARTATAEGLARAQSALADGLERTHTEASRSLTREAAALKRRMGAIEDLVRVERLLRQTELAERDRTTAGSPADTRAHPEPTGIQALLDSFYFRLEARYRGSREEIKQRLGVYRTDLRAARDRTGASGPIIDIGCGRGELVELAAEDGFRAVGVDSNDLQLDEARKHGCAVIHGEALDHLRMLEAGSLLAVTGIHIVEHIPFADLMVLMREVARVVMKGGVAIFETPNPRNLIVGATTFHFDPTHIRPLPPEILGLLLETVGFADVETRTLHPSPTLEHMVQNDGLNRHIATLLFGPQDYAAIGVME